MGAVQKACIKKKGIIMIRIKRINESDLYQSSGSCPAYGPQGKIDVYCRWEENEETGSPECAGLVLLQCVYADDYGTQLAPLHEHLPLLSAHEEAVD